MLVEMLMYSIYSLVNLLTNAIHIPELPEAVYDSVDIILSFVSQSLGILSVYVDLPYLLLLLSLVLALDVALFAYYVLMWVLRKIPLLNIK